MQFPLVAEIAAKLLLLNGVLNRNCRVLPIFGPKAGLQQ
jgi:hypothetical protein